MQPDNDAMLTFARFGIRLFWLRQVMFVGATVITSAYLENAMPIILYLVCLGAELSEVRLSHGVLREQVLSEDRLRQLVRHHGWVAVWSATGVSVYAVLSAWMGPPEYLFVPMAYLFSAALYATMFNHQISQILLPRMMIYSVGFLLIAGLGLTSVGSDQLLLGFAQFLTLVSAALFIAINAIVMRRSYTDRQRQLREAEEREDRLLKEIRDRQTAEDARHSSDQRFRTLFENAPIPIREEDLSGMKRLIDQVNLPDPQDFGRFIDDNPDFLRECADAIVVVDANRASLLQHGYAEKTEMLKHVVRELAPAAQDVVRMTATALNAGDPGRSYQTRIRRTDGEERTVAATWSVLPGHEDTYARILLCSIDMTDRLAAEEALLQAQKMEAVGQLTGGVAHDINNLLTVIRGNVDLLESTIDLDGSLSEPIKSAIDRGAELTRGLLAFSRKQPLSRRTFELGEHIRRMTTLLRRTLGEENLIEIDIPDDLWPVFADAAQVEAALLNLALNSRDAMVDGGVLTISCRNLPIDTGNEMELEAGDYVVLSVADTGIGMDAQTRSRAIDPFFTTKEPDAGTGLGLSMVYGFAKQSGGTLHIESTPGEGTAISLYLPRSTQGAVAVAQSDDTETHAEARGQTILVLEKDDGVRSFLTRLLETSGYEVLQADSAETARDVVAGASRIDLLLSDIMLPGGTRGPEFAREMLDRNNALPVIFMSGRPSEIESAASVGFGDASVLAKPFTKDALLGRISRSLAARSVT